MTIKLTWHYLVGLFILCCLFILLHTNNRPFANNQWKSHRWISEGCTKVGRPATDCMLVIKPMNSSETVLFDLCLEHGEWKRAR